MGAEFWSSTIPGLLVVAAGCVILALVRWRSCALPEGWAMDSRSVLDVPREAALRESRRVGRRSVLIAGWCVVASAGPAVLPVLLPVAVWLGALVLGAAIAGVFLVHGAVTFAQASVIDSALRALDSGATDDCAGR